VNPEKNTLYDLVAVINHRGSLSGGHYVAYAKNHKNDKWYEFDDKTVTEVTEDIVKGVEAYVLFFQKQVPLSRKQEVKQIKSLIKSKLGLETPVYISNYWYSKWESMSDPGPIDSDFLCKHGFIKTESLENINNDFKVIPLSAYTFLHEKYGGAPPLFKLNNCETCENERNQLIRRREAERKAITERDRTKIGPGEFWYLVSSHWLQRWHNFVVQGSDVLAGPITNTDLFDSHNKLRPFLVRARDYRGVTKEVYEYFKSMYGGGPDIKRPSLDIYDTTGLEDR